MSMNVGQRPANLPPDAGQTPGQVPGQAGQSAGQPVGQQAQGQGVPGQPGQPTTGQPTGQPGSAAQAKGAQQTGQSSGTTGAQKSNKAQDLHSTDSVERKTGESSLELDSEFGPPSLPDLSLPTSEKHAQSETVAGVVGAFADVAKDSLTMKNLEAVLDRADFLVKNPDQSMYAQVLGADFGQQIANLLQQMPLQGIDTQFVTQRFGADAADLVGRHNQASLDFVAQNVLGGEGPFFGLNQEQFAFGAKMVEGMVAEGIKSFQAGDNASTIFQKVGMAFSEAPMHMQAEGAGVSPGPNNFPTIRNGIGENNPKLGTGEVIQKVAFMAEAAGYEFLVGQFQKLQSDDAKKRMQQLQDTLTTLKKQKEGLAAHINKLSSEIIGKEVAGAAQSKKLEEAQECARNWAIVKAIVMVIVAVVIIVVTVIASPFSGGTSLLAGVAAVAAIVSCVITIVQAVPQLIQAVGLLLGAMGFKDAEKALMKAADWITENIMNNEYFKWTCFAIQMVCVVVSLGCSVASLAGAGAAVAKTATDAAQTAQQAAEAAKVAAAAAEKAATLQKVSSVTNMAAGAANIGISVGMYEANKDIAAAMQQLAMLKGEMAKIDVQIKEILVEIQRLENKESTAQDGEKDDIERDEKFRKISADMAAAGASMAQAVNDYGRG